MPRLNAALLERSLQGTPVGADIMIMRVNQELADEAPIVVSDPRRLHESPTRQRRWGWAFALGVLLVVAAVALPVWLLGGGQDAEPATTTLPPTTAAPPTTVLPMPDVWQRVGVETMAPVNGLFDMAPAGNGLIAVGFDATQDGRFTGAIFRSEDWVTWKRTAAGDAALETGKAFMYEVIEGGPGLVAVGMGCEGPDPCSPYPTVWTSVDGNVWARSGSDPDVFGEHGAMLDVVALDSGLLAVGNIEELATDGGLLARPAVWSSADGVEWSRTWEGDPIDSGDSMLLPGFNSLTVGGDGLLVGVGMAQNGTGALVAAVWTSADGRSWERVAADNQEFAGAGGVAVDVIDVTSGSSGFVAVGTEGGTAPALWHSPEGYLWSRIDTTLQPFDNVASLGSVTALDSGYMAAGPDGFRDRHGGVVTLWTSPDGLRWDRVEAQGAGYAAAIVPTERGIALAGSVPGEAEPQAGVWVGPTFDPARPPIDPQPAPLALPVESATSQAPAAVLSCRELAERGYSYGRVVAYWSFRHLHEDLDPDGNGVPCEAEYPADEVAALYGSPGGQPVSISFNVQSNTFTAEGQAIDGLFCSSGTVTGTDDQGEEQPQFPDSLYREDDNIYMCADGSGEFTLAMEFFFESSRQVIGVWWVIDGAGDYESLAGGGTYVVRYEGTETTEIVGRLGQT